MTLKLKRNIWGLLFLLPILSTTASNTTFTSWKFKDLSTINDISVSPEGNPEIININNESAYLFDGSEDRVVIDSNPLIGLDEFTVEVVFRIDKGGVAEQKMFHLQANPDIRLLFEIEFVNDSMWYMENYIQSGSDEGANIHLMDSTKLHPVNRWVHAAVVYKNKEFKQYINYTSENTGNLSWIAPESGSVSVGARINKLNYFTGAVREIRFADAALDSTEFLFYNELLEQHETFVLNNLEKINGHTLQVFGNPQVVETEIGTGIEFDGDQDGIYIFTNPIGSSTHFTIETIVKLKDVAPANAEPRYFHIEDADNSNRRITMELRLNDKHEWYFDGFLKATKSISVGLMDETLTHPIGGWEHMAITYDNGLFKTYVNYSQELESNWGPKFLPLGENTKVSVGMRMNKVNYFQGTIQRIRVTKAVLDSSQFMTIDKGSVSSIDQMRNERNDNLDLFVKVFPNPTNNSVNVQLKGENLDRTSVELYNSMGLRLDEICTSEISCEDATMSFDTSLYSQGLYVVKIGNDQNVVTKKILIQ